VKRSRAAVHAAALAFPGAHEDHPWGETVVKVDGKIFVFLGEVERQGYRLTLKLPASHEPALALEGAAPTGYGLGRAGWVTFPVRGDVPPLAVLLEWLEESYRAVARKLRIAELDATAVTKLTPTRPG
jgi:predicted DNA-binding protein (MmcQ/YjbR family)